MSRGMVYATLGACFLSMLFAFPAEGSEKEAQRLDAARVELDASTGSAQEALDEIALVRTRLKMTLPGEQAAGRDADAARAQLETATRSVRSERRAASEQVRQAKQEEKSDRDDWEGSVIFSWALVGLLLALGFSYLVWLTVLTSSFIRRLANTPRGKVTGALAGSTLLGVLIGSMVSVSGSGSRPMMFLGGIVVGCSIGSAIAVGIAVWEARRLIADRAGFGRRPAAYGIGSRVIVGGITGVFLLIMIGTALTSSEPSPEPIPPETLAMARMGSPKDEPTPRIRVLTRALAMKLNALNIHQSRREALEDQLDSKAASLDLAQSQILRARRSYVRWENALNRPDPAPVEVYEPYVEEDPAPVASGSCDPNYSGCVPLYPPDVNCADIGGSVSVIGSDPHGLDADSDGIGCE